MSLKKVETVLNEIYALADRLGDLLEPYDSHVIRLGLKSVKELSLTERIKFAKFLLEIRDGMKED